jgi:hypothetical protein
MKFGRILIALMFLVMIVNAVDVASSIGGIVSPVGEAIGSVPYVPCNFNLGDVNPPPCASAIPITLRQMNWAINGIIAVAIAFLAVGIIFMISNALNESELRAWALNEFWQATGTAIVVLAVFIIVGIENQAFGAFGFPAVSAVPITDGPTNPAIASAHTFLLKSWKYTLGGFVAAVAGYSESSGILRNWELYSEQKGHEIPILPGKILFLPANFATADFINGAFGKIFGFVTNPLSASLGMMTIQMFILCVMDALGFAILLPLGIVLRSVPFCRGLGTAFIAIAIGFYVVYPLVLLLNEKIIIAMMNNKTTWWEDAIPPSAAAHLKIACVSSVAQVGIATYEIFSKGPSELRSWFKKFNMAALVYSAVGMLDLMFIMLQRSAFIVVVLGAFLPFLSIVITFGVTRQIAKLMGSDINLNTLLKVL